MTTLHDGPAHAARLSLNRSPVFLRVVIDPAGNIDALDQLTDTPAADETIAVYHLEREPGVMFIDRTVGGRRVGSAQPLADYRFHTPQPTDAEVRETAAWQEWTTAEGKRLNL